MGFFTTRSLAFLAATAALLVPAQAQTYTKCDPLKKSCPPDPALGGTASIDFTTSGQSSDFTASGDVTYGSSGMEMAVSSSNRGPYQQSKWYMMFGRVDVTMKAAPGAGVVSSFILQSDDLDEIDLEWVGDQGTTLQTNFFGKGFTGTWNRGITYQTVDATADFHTYTIDWNAERTEWSVDGTVLRTLVPSDFPGQYPQSPMFIKFGPWAAGDPTSNPPGTVHWADGPIDWSAGPYPMYVESITAQDYSTGTAYKYTGTSGTWESIVAIGGTVNGAGSGGSSKSSSVAPHSSTSHVPKLSTTAQRSGMTTSIPSALPTTTTAPNKHPSSKDTSSKDTSSKDTSSKDTSSKATSSTGKSVPAHTTSSPHMTMPTGYHNNSTMTSSTRKTSSSNTGAPSSTPTSGSVSGKQTAWVLSLACAAVGLIAFL